MRKFLTILLAFAPLTAAAEPKILSPGEFKTQLEIMEVFATHLESYTEDGMFKLAIEAS